MSTLTRRRLDRPGAVDPRIGIMAWALLGALGCGTYISTLFLLSDLSTREAVRSPVTIASNLIVAVAFAVLAISLPGLRSTLAVPGWAVVATSLGSVGIAATAWGTATLGVHAAGLLSDDQMEESGLWFDIFQGPQVLPCTVGFLALAATGWRRASMPRGAAVLFALAGLLSAVPAYPPGALIGALAIAWAAGANSKLAATTEPMPDPDVSRT